MKTPGTEPPGPEAVYLQILVDVAEIHYLQILLSRDF